MADRGLPTVRDVLAIPALAVGEPRVIAGEAFLGRPVRWVHVAEIPDIGRLLEGGELILTTGIGLAADEGGQRQFVGDLARAGAAGLVIELGRRFTSATPWLVEAAQEHELPLVVLSREVRFVRITEAVHELIISSQLAQLRRLDQVHRTFTAMSVAGARPEEVVHQVAELLDAPVVLEDLARHVIAWSSEATDVIDDWAQRSRAIRSGPKAAATFSPPWLSSPVQARGDGWGRLLVLVGDDEPDGFTRTVVERAATALAIDRLVERDRETLEQQTHRTLVAELLRGAPDATAEVAVRARAMGIELVDRPLRGVVVRTQDSAGDLLRAEARRRDLTHLVRDALTLAGRPGLVGSLSPTTVAALVVLPLDGGGDGWLDRLAAHVHDRPGTSPGLARVTIGAGTRVDSLAEARRSLGEAQQVAEAVATAEGPRRPWHDLADLGIRGLLHVLQGDDRLEAYIGRELSRLVDDGNGDGDGELLETLRAWLDVGGHKSHAADALGISRGTIYARLDRIASLLGVELDNAEVRLSLHVALLAREGRPAA